VVQRYGYQEIRLPILTEAQGVAAGEPEADSVMLRPEGTLSCVRALLALPAGVRQSGQRWWYQGPMFRREGQELDQFHQFGVEAFGMAGAEIDAELILLCWDIFSALGLHRHLMLEINDLAEPEPPAGASPPRALFSAFCHLLDQAGIAYRINPALGRERGYYCAIIFVWSLEQPGGQRVILASGGRYDALAAQLAAASLPATGFAVDIEHLLQLLPRVQYGSGAADAQIVLRAGSVEMGLEVVMLSRDLRRKLPTLSVRSAFSDSQETGIPAGADWLVTLYAADCAQVWSRENGSEQRVAVGQVVDLIAGRLLRPVFQAEPKV